MGVLWTPAAPAILHRRCPLLEGHGTNWRNVARKHGETRFRIRGFFPDREGLQVSHRSFVRHFVDDPEDAEDFWSRLVRSSEGDIARWPSWLPAPEDFPGLVYEFASITFLTTPAVDEDYNRPADWNDANNSVEGIGASGGAAGGGGAYAKVTNLAPSDPVAYTIGTASNGHNTQFVDASTLVAAAAFHFQGGATADSVGSTKFAGGSAINGSSICGGGGAAGPNGAGANAGNATFAAGNGGGGGGGGSGGTAGTNGSGSTGGNGGNGSGSGGNGGTLNNNGSLGGVGAGGGAGGGSSTGTGKNGGNGGAGHDWDATHGAGGGGGGFGVNNSGGGFGTGGDGGNYGAGAGFNGTGSGGLLVVTYVPIWISHFPRSAPVNRVYLRR